MSGTGAVSAPANPLAMPAAAARRPTSSGEGFGSSKRDTSPMSEDGRGAATFGAEGISRRQVAGKVLIGRPARAPDKRRYRYDVQAGRKDPVTFSATKSDRMAPGEAGDMLDRIHELMGVKSAAPNVLYAFDRGMFFCHTINGASTLNPGRAVWSVPGYTHEFEYSKVRDILGVDIRRFFRAFADDITKANKYVLDNFDPDDAESVEQRGYLVAVAAERGLNRYPELAHDSADCCLELDIPQRNALMLSKKLVLSSVSNVADRTRITSRTATADGFDGVHEE